MASYPGAVKTFTTKNAGDTIQPAHVNDLQDEVNAIEDGLLNGLAPITSSRIVAPALSVSAGTTLTTLQVTGASTFTGGMSVALSTIVSLVTGNLSVAAALAISNSTTATLSSGNTDDLSLPSSITWLITTAHANGSTLTGMTAGAAGRIVGIMNYGANTALVIANETGSTALARFTPGTTLAPSAACLCVYVGNRWRIFVNGQ